MSLGIKVPDIGIQGEYVHVDFTLIEGDLATVDLFMSEHHSLSGSRCPVASHVSAHRNHPPMVVIIPLGVSPGTYQFVATKVGDASVEYARSNSITVHSSTSGRIKVPEHGHRGTSVSIEFRFPESGPTKVDLILWEQDSGEHVLVAEDMHVERDDPQALDVPLQVEPGQYQFVATTGYVLAAYLSCSDAPAGCAIANIARGLSSEERTIYASSNMITVD